MADNVGYTPGAGSTVAADDIAGVLYQRVKLVIGADGTSNGDVSSANPMPVVVDGSVAVTGTFWQATQPVSGTFWQATQPVSGTFWQATQPVSAASLPLPSGAATEATLAGVATAASAFKTRSDTYTGTANGVTVDCSTVPLQTFSMAVKGTGASATTWDLRLESSLDNVNFTTVLTHTNTTGDGIVLFSGAVLSPSLYIRTRCAGLVLGGASNIVVTLLGQR